MPKKPHGMLFTSGCGSLAFILLGPNIFNSGVPNRKSTSVMCTNQTKCVRYVLHNVMNLHTLRLHIYS